MIQPDVNKAYLFELLGELKDMPRDEVLRTAETESDGRSVRISSTARFSSMLVPAIVSAPAKHSVAHTPQPTHAARSAAGCPGRWTPRGHTAAHLPQPMHSSRLYSSTGSMLRDSGL